MGYGWPGGLRPSPSSLLPRLPRHPDLLRRRLPRLPRQRAGEGTDAIALAAGRILISIR